jgi:hypothetical protein
MVDGGRHGAPLSALPHTTVTQNVGGLMYGGAVSEAPCQPWDDGGRRGRWVHGLASFSYLLPRAKTHTTRCNN